MIIVIVKKLKKLRPKLNKSELRDLLKEWGAFSCFLTLSIEFCNLKFKFNFNNFYEIKD